jgi:hypothetical protein
VETAERTALIRRESHRIFVFIACQHDLLEAGKVWVALLLARFERVELHLEGKRRAILKKRKESLFLKKKSGVGCGGVRKGNRVSFTPNL